MVTILRSRRMLIAMKIKRMIVVGFLALILFGLSAFVLLN